MYFAGFKCHELKKGCVSRLFKVNTNLHKSIKVVTWSLQNCQKGDSLLVSPDMAVGHTETLPCMESSAGY